MEAQRERGHVLARKSRVRPWSSSARVLPLDLAPPNDRSIRLIEEYHRSLLIETVRTYVLDRLAGMEERQYSSVLGVERALRSVPTNLLVVT